MYSTYYGVYDDHSSSYNLGCQECQSLEIFIGVVVLKFSDIRVYIFMFKTCGICSWTKCHFVTLHMTRWNLHWEYFRLIRWLHDFMNLATHFLEIHTDSLIKHCFKKNWWYQFYLVHFKIVDHSRIGKTTWLSWWGHYWTSLVHGFF